MCKRMLKLAFEVRKNISKNNKDTIFIYSMIYSLYSTEEKRKKKIL